MSKTPVAVGASKIRNFKAVIKKKGISEKI